ncbi:MAG: polysaccharide biosynthesis tyrosine autokinase [Pseudomonadota bacterium]
MRERLSDQFEGSREDSGGADIVLDFGRILEIIRNGWWIIALCGFLAALVAAIAVLQVTPKFQARAQILLSTPNNSTTAIENLFPELTLSKEAVAGEIAVMKTSRQLRMVSEQLDLASEPEFNPELLPVEEPGFFTTLVDTTSDRIKVMLGGDLEPVSPISEEPSERAISRIAQLERETRGDQDVYIGTLARNLSVNRVGSSYLVDITYTSVSRETAAAVPNAVVDAYLAYQLEQKFGASVEMTEKLSQRLQDLERRVEDSERKVINFRNDMLTAGFGGEERTEQQLRDMAIRQNEAEAEFAELQSELTQIDVEISERGLLAVAGLFSSQAIDRLREEISQLQQNVNQMRQRFGSDTSRIEFVQSEIVGLEQAIEQEVQQLRDSKVAQLEIARGQRDALRTELQDLEARALEQSRAQIELAKLLRTQDANRVVYNSFLATVTEMNEVSGLASADAQVVSYASPPDRAVTPRKKETVAIGMFGGIFLGLGIVFARAFMDNSIRSAQQLSDITGGRHVQVVPGMPWSIFKKDPLHYMIRKPRSSISEAIRALRGQILVNAGDVSGNRALQRSGRARDPGKPATQKKRVITLCSATPQVGKTTTCIALARSFAEMGRSCVVIDTDLRRGSIAKTLGMDPYPDLVDVLANEVDIQSVFHQDPHSSAMIITSRDTPKDPGGLLISPGMEMLVNALADHFDIVIMDTSPLLAVSDAIPICRMADEVILLARAGKTTVTEVQETAQMLNRVNVPISSMVLSMASERDSSAVFSDYVQN